MALIIIIVFSTFTLCMFGKQISGQAAPSALG